MDVYAVMKRKDSNCFGISFDQGEAATASNLSEYTGCPKKKYTSLKSYIFVLRTDKSLNYVSFIRQDFNLNYET